MKQNQLQQQQSLQRGRKNQELKKLIQMIPKKQMKSKKDQGNDFFKKQKYQEAINSYNQYVKVDHADNSKAYGNIALSYFRLKKYGDCIRACESAVQVEPEFQKAFYRMYEAYRQLKDNYGMLIAAQRFCKLSKQQKDIKLIQKELGKIKEDLCYGQSKHTKNLQTDKIILQILSQHNETNDSQKAKKEPQICLQSNWQKIQQIVKDNQRIAINQARKFLNQQCKTQEQKLKYKKLLSKLKNTLQNKSTNSKSNQNKEDSSEEEPKVQELHKYTFEQQLKVEEASKIEHKSQQQTPTQTITNKVKSQPVLAQLNHTQAQLTNQSIAKNQNIINNQLQAKWEDYIKQETAQKLFEIHIKSKIAKSQDQFVAFFQSLCNVIGSSELDKFQKEAILSVTPQKLKKFNMLMKSYTGKQKQQLGQLFTQHNLHKVMEKHYLKK